VNSNEVDDRVSIRMPAEMLNRLKKLADEDSRTVSNYIRLIIKKEIEGYVDDGQE
jgi:predicted DNA-binding protein